MARPLRTDTEWLVLPGKTLAQIEAVAIRASWMRHEGNQRKMRGELGISKSNLLRKLDKIGLRHRRPRDWRLTERHLAMAFDQHRKSIADELNISDSTLTRWLNSKAPFAVEE